MYVTALDPDGGPLPGVRVEVVGPVSRQTQYTRVDGTARFPGLYPGVGYTATFTLEGFKPAVREDLVISAQQTTKFGVVMELASVEETLVVTGESPLVDVKSTGIAPKYANTLIDLTPTASGIWAGVLDHIPGIVPTTDVGGESAGVQWGLRAWGSESSNATYNVNGADITNQFFTGSSNMYYSISSFEEVSVSIAAQDVEIKTAGVNSNMVVKSGGNDWHAGIKYFYEGEGLVSDNVDEDLEEQGVTGATASELLSDLDLQVGGPIVRDQAWLFVDHWRWDQRREILGLEERDWIRLRDVTLNVNAQVTDNNKVAGRFLYGQKYRNNRGASRRRPYLGRVQDSVSHIPQIQWQAVLSQNAFLDVRYSHVNSVFPLVRRWSPGDDEPGAVPSTLSATWDFAINDYVARPSLPTNEFVNDEASYSLNGSTSWYVAGDSVGHDVKFGANYLASYFVSPVSYPNGYRPYVDSRNDPMGNPGWEVGVPQEVRLYNTPTAFVHDDVWYPDNAYALEGHSLGLFAQDTLTIDNRLTITAGVRFDYAANWNPSQNRLDSAWCGMAPLANPEAFCAETFVEEPKAIAWKDLVPRIGVIYDLRGDGRWALKLNYARYAEALQLSRISALNINDPGREDWNWVDDNGDGRFQFGEHTTFRDASFPRLGTAIDPELSSPLTDELTFGVEHELRDNLMVGVSGIVRGMRNDTGNVDIGRPFGPMLDAARCLAECDPDMSTYVDPYFPVQTVDPGNDGIIGTADDGLPVTIWARDPAVAGDGNLLTTNPEEWGFSDRIDYRGVSFIVQKRWANNWQLLASYDYGRSHFESAGTTPSAAYNNRRQEQYASRPHIFKVTANYLIAEPIGVNLGVFVRANSGEPVRAEYTYDDELLEPPNSPYPNQGNQRIYVDGRGEGNEFGSFRPEREDFVTIVDVRAEKQLTVGRYGVLHFYFDVFNLFNANTVLEFNWTLGSRYGEIQEILHPRVIRLGGAWDF